MKTTRKTRIFAASATALMLLASCQRQEFENLNTQEDLVPVSLTASFNTVETKVSYTETTTDDIKLQPAWTVGDKIIGLDEATPTKNTYTFTVSKVAEDGTATLDGECPANCSLHLIYLYGATASSISSGSLDVSYAGQVGTGSTDDVYTMPAVMLADGTVTDGTGDFHFSNAGAIIGIKAVKGVPCGPAVSSITFSGENLSAATIALDGSSLKLTAKENADDAISTTTLSGVTVTDANGTLSKPVLIAVPAGAKVSKVTAAVGGMTYSFKLGSAVELASGRYSYINGKTFTKDRVSVSVVANPSGFASLKIDGYAVTSKEVTSGTEVTIKAEPITGDYVFLKWSDGNTDNPRTVTVTEDVVYTAVFSYKITANIPVGYVYGTSIVVYLDVNKAELTAFAPTETSFVGWIKEGGDGTILSANATYTTDPSDISSATNFIPVFKSVATSQYVDIITTLNNDKTVKTHTKWAKQNVSTSTSGGRSWKGGNTSAVKVPGTDEDVKVGDYFQWAGKRLIYTSFLNKQCGDSKDEFTFINSSNIFNENNMPYDRYHYYSAKEYISIGDDIARNTLGGKWRIPDPNEFTALYNATKWTWDSTDKGYYITSKGETLSSDKSNALLFFPAAGSGNYNYLASAGNGGGYWSRLKKDTGIISLLSFSGTSVNPNSETSPYLGYSVRPVSD